MDRREFIRSAGTVTAASLVTASHTVNASENRQSSSDDSSPTASTGSWFDPTHNWHFFDLWHFDHIEGMKLRQGIAKWQPDATYTEQPIGNLAAWPTVYFDEATGMWRMLYSAAWKPFRLMIAESEDGRKWRPLAQPHIQPDGSKVAPHHIFTLLGGSGGAVYLDPLANDGFPFKVFAHIQGKPAYDRAIADSNHRWHDVAKRNGVQKYINEELTLVSQDGINWEPRFDMGWSKADWHPEPPIFGHFNRFTNQHVMTVRPGWGDRRVCSQWSSDFNDWSGPQLVLQPDMLDEELIELYGMPVFSYGDGYVGLPWIFHCESIEPTRGFNRSIGTLDCQLAFSHDGTRFDRGLREPFISTGDPDEPHAGAIEPSCLIETDDEIRIYSSASRVHHGQGSDAKRRGIEAASITVHTLRKDGLTFLETIGDQGRFISKPLVLFSPQLTINASAPHGELRFQVTDMESRPVEGFTFDDSVALSNDDSMNFGVAWKHHRLDGLVGKIVRLEVSMQNARLYAVRGHFHFIDAQDRSLIQDRQPIAT